MLIKCPKCGFENQLGGIFCRNCGEKLDIERIRPRIADKSGGFNFFGIARKLIGLILFVAVVGVLVAMFIPGNIAEYPTLTDTPAQNAAKEKIKNLIARVDEQIGDEKYTFTSEEATFVYNDTFVGKIEGESGGAYNIEKIAFKIDQQGFVRIFLATKLGGKIPVTFELKGSPVKIEGASDGSIPVSFNVIECKMGKMPIKFVENKIIEKFLPALTGGKVDKILRSLKSLELTEDKNFAITVK
jgi:hypothetical protein